MNTFAAISTLALTFAIAAATYWLGRYLAAGRQFARLEHAREYIDSELALAG